MGFQGVAGISEGFFGLFRGDLGPSQGVSEELDTKQGIKNRMERLCGVS